MIYVICYDWASTSGNHTGMRYLYEYIQKSNPELYKMYTFNMGGRFLDKGKRGKKISIWMWCSAENSENKTKINSITYLSECLLVNAKARETISC